MPSIVMLIAPCGRPLTVESREPPGVLTPAVYLPGLNCGIVNCPCSFDTASDVTAVSARLTTTLAPGMIAPDASVTLPDNVDVTPPCANAAGAPKASTATARKAATISL